MNTGDKVKEMRRPSWTLGQLKTLLHDNRNTKPLRKPCYLFFNPTTKHLLRIKAKRNSWFQAPL